MFKKVLFASAILVAGLGFTACSSDDDNNPPVEANPLVGEWKAFDITYEIPGVGSHTVLFSQITDGCDVEELHLKEDNSVDMETEVKVDGNCTEAHTSGSWDNSSIMVEGEETPREIVSVTENELQLKYVLSYANYPSAEAIVKYIK